MSTVPVTPRVCASVPTPRSIYQVGESTSRQRAPSGPPRLDTTTRPRVPTSMVMAPNAMCPTSSTPNPPSNTNSARSSAAGASPNPASTAANRLRGRQTHRSGQLVLAIWFWSGSSAVQTTIVPAPAARRPVPDRSGSRAHSWCVRRRPAPGAAASKARRRASSPRSAGPCPAPPVPKASPVLRATRPAGRKDWLRGSRGPPKARRLLTQTTPADITKLTSGEDSGVQKLVEWSLKI